MHDFISFLGPYVEIARVRGEIRSDIDSDAAAEWVARLLFSLYSTPSPTRDLDDPEVTRQFVADFALPGLQGPPRTPSTPSTPAAIAAVLDASR
jgi:hypothetical protein